ncbi:MAG: hypothetical protein ABIP48_13765 [Planctomycetota bacterium]
MKVENREMKVGGRESLSPHPSPLTPHPSPLAPAIRSKLAALRRRIRRYVWLDGLAAAITWLGVAFWASLAVDWFFEPPRAVRALVLGIVGFGLAWVLFRRILRRAFVRLTNRNMAMLIERHFPQFDESLLTAVELTDEGRGARDEGRGARDEGRGVWGKGRGARRQETAPLLPHPAPLTSQPSPHGREMLAQTCRRAAEPIGDVRLRDVFNPAPLRISAGAAVLFAAGIWAFSALAPAAFGTWTQRSLLLDDQLWPRKTRLIVEGFEDGVGKVARGTDLEVIAKADLAQPVVPKVVEVRYQIEGGSRQRAAMSREGEADPAKDKFQEYSHTFRGVLEPIRFDVVGGDAAVRDLRIEVVDSPTIVEMVLDCRFPDYMERSSSPLSVTGVMQLPVGTAITVRASANKDLVKVEVDDGRGARVKGQEARDERRQGTLAPHPSPLTSHLSHLTPHLSTLTPRRSFSCTLPDFTEDTTLLFTLFDTDGIKSREPVRLVLAAIADEAPRLSVELRGIGPAITPQARLPVAGPITDDYGIARVWFDYSIDEQPEATRVVRSTSGNPTEIALDEALEVRDLELTPGQKLLVCVKAADRYDLAEAPNVGAGRQWLLDVVTPEQLRTRLEARELVLRQRFERIAQEVTETRDSLLRVDFAAPETEAKQDTETEESGDGDEGNEAGSSGAEAPEDPDDEDALSPQRLLARRALRVERASQNSRKNAHETLGLAEAFLDIREELINNRIDTAELTSRLERGIADPLDRIANEMFPELDRRLDRLEATLADDRFGEDGPQNRDLAVAQVDAILQAIQSVLDRMLELEDFNKAVELLREIIHAQQRLNDQTQSRHKQKLRELLEE